MQRNAPDERTPVPIPAADRERRHHAYLPVHQSRRTARRLHQGEYRQGNHPRFTATRPAPRVNVLFHETQEGRHFVAGQRSGQSIGLGAIRHGRNVETRQAMLTELANVDTPYRGSSEGEILSSHSPKSPLENRALRAD